MSSNFRLQGMETRQQALAGSRCLRTLRCSRGGYREEPSVTGKVEKSSDLHMARIWISAEPGLGCIWAILKAFISAQIPPVQRTRESVGGKCFVSICMGRQKQEKDEWEMVGEGEDFVSISLDKFTLLLMGLNWNLPWAALMNWTRGLQKLLRIQLVKKHHCWGGRAVSAVKITECSCRGPAFSSQHPYRTTHNF